MKADALKFEQEKGTFNYYLNYKEYYIFYNFAVDPEVYLQLPIDEKMYIKLGDQDKETAATAPPEPAKNANTQGPNKPLGEPK